MTSAEAMHAGVSMMRHVPRRVFRPGTNRRSRLLALP
jgi:hypothetical protein